MDVDVRRIRPDEWPRQRALRLRALADAPMAFGSTLADESAFADEVWVRRAAAGAAGRERVTFVAEREQRWVGLATGLAAAPDRPAPEVAGMFVEPAARGCGVVEALLDAIVGWARDGGAQRLCLWVTSTNTAAIRAYTRYGFRPTGDTQPLAHTPSVTRERRLRAAGARLRASHVLGPDGNHPDPPLLRGGGLVRGRREEGPAVGRLRARRGALRADAHEAGRTVLRNLRSRCSPDVTGAYFAGRPGPQQPGRHSISAS